MKITTNSYKEIKDFYDNVLNKDRESFKTSNDEPTPIGCVEEMINKLPDSFWKSKRSILDPCCGNGNFHVVIFNKLKKYHSEKKILEKMLYFNDINEDRIKNVQKIFDNENLNITKHDYLQYPEEKKYSLIVANPPYAKLLPNGKRASKNHNMIGSFISKTLRLLKEGGIMIFITPDNWMSMADRNKLISILTAKQILYLNIHTAKKYFKKVGSSFTWYIIQNIPSYKDFQVEGIWKKEIYKDKVKSEVRRFIPLYYNKIIQDILHKTVENDKLKKFIVETSSDLHRYTKKKFISNTKDEIFKYKLIHTPKQTVYASRPHKFQEGWKVFISTTSYYSTFVDDCGMTQSIVFIRCKDKEEAENIAKVLTHPLYCFINNICRWGNFNNIRILQSFPYCDNYYTVYKKFNFTQNQIDFIRTALAPKTTIKKAINR